MSNYNPDTFDHGCPDATISDVAYIVTSFSDSNPPVEVDFQTGKGAHRGAALEQGKRTATMTIEVKDEAQTPPAVFATFTYQGSTWVIKQLDKSRAAATASTYNLQLNWVNDSGGSV
jgi:hypothetical protein